MKLIEQVMDMDNLAKAWQRVAENRGAPGVDQISIRRFARHWEENLRRIRDLVWTNRYKPAGLRRIAVPKSRGEGQRLIAIPIVADRVLQRAVLNVVDDLFDREFLECSYGYRQGRGLRQAVAALLRYRDQGLIWVLEADIDDCFDSLDQELLTGFLVEKLDDPQVMELMRAWLQVGCRFRNPDRGIALGMPVSPLCCNVYLHRLDWELARHRWAVVRYADDLVVCCAGQRQAEQAREVVADALADLHLRLEPAKTRVTSFEQGFEFLGVRFDRDSYSFLWAGKAIEVEGPVPAWIWGYMPEGYD
jgi:group II intron reverse transcriptase/maturase